MPLKCPLAADSPQEGIPVRYVILAVIAAALLVPSTAAAKPASNYTQAKAAISKVFGRYASQAMRVASCETGGTYDPRARNGQYLGIFQMGSYARGRYGHSSSWLGQAQAAYRYFVDSGRDWSPWSCKPW